MQPKKQKPMNALLLGMALCLFGALGLLSPTALAQTGVWTPTGSMHTARLNQTATLLLNGEVLVAGGSDGSVSLASAELYDPSTGVWTPTGSMTSPRNNSTATLLANGKVLVGGGENSTGALSSAELYDSDTGTWTLTGSMNTMRTAHMAGLITVGPLTGMVLVAGGSSVCGGCTPVLDSAELYDPSTGLWTFTGSMTLARVWPYRSPPTLPDGSILGVGGITCCPYHWIDKAETYNPLTQIWTATARKNTTAQGPTALMLDGRVLVAGGVTGTQPTALDVAAAEFFDSSTGTWTPTASMSIDRNAHTLTLLASGQALVAGGAAGGWGVCNDLASAELYDSSAGTWFLTGSMNAARFYHSATLLPNGQVLAAGGQNCESHFFSSAELYTPPPAVALSSVGLTFGVQLVGTRSDSQPITLTNTGTSTLTITSIAANGDFREKNDCGSSVAAGASCTINIAFSPTKKDSRRGAVTITDDAVNSPQTIALTGTGTVVQLSPVSVNFGKERVGMTSAPQIIIVTNVGSEVLNISAIGISGTNFGDFVDKTTCGSTLAGGASCNVRVTFRPTATGARDASLVITDDGGGRQQRIPLAGTGI